MSEVSNTVVRQRVRLRFRKTGDLRWISHRDLLRTLERLFRRADLPLGMSEGFHPKPRLTFPLALAVGIEARDEVMELELARAMSADEIESALAAATLPGLEFFGVEMLPPGTKKAQVARVVCEFAVPTERAADVAERIGRLLAATECLVPRGDEGQTIDLRQYVEQLEVTGGVLRMTLRVTTGGTARPREVLTALGLEDLEQQGQHITRTQVELTS